MPTRRSVLRHAAAASLGAALWPRTATSGAEEVSLEERCAAVMRGWDAITDHRTGTSGDRATADWLANVVAERGAAARLDAFPFTRRVVGDCFVEVEGHRADGVPCFDGAFTSEHGLQATLAPLTAARDIGVTDYSSSAPSTTIQTIVAARRAARHAAIVAITPGRGGVTPVNADAYLAPFGPPVLQVAADHAGWLGAAAAAHANARFVAHATSERTTAYNVQVRIDGREPTLPPLVVMTPRSGWWVCTSERGGGIAVWLELIGHFVAHRPDRTVLFTANSGHELGHLGLDTFLERQPTLLAGAFAWVHLGANFAATGGSIRFQASDDALMAHGVDLLARHGQHRPSTTPVGTRPYGEARNIFDGGGRFVSLLGDNALFHHPDDRWPHAVDVPKTTALCAAMVELADQLARV